MKSLPSNLKAMAELEIRRRHRERAAKCVLCGIDAHYTAPEDMEPCSHTREEQDPESSFNQGRTFEHHLDLIYGDDNEFDDEITPKYQSGGRAGNATAAADAGERLLSV